MVKSLNIEKFFAIRKIVKNNLFIGDNLFIKILKVNYDFLWNEQGISSLNNFWTSLLSSINFPVQLLVINRKSDLADYSPIIKMYQKSFRKEPDSYKRNLISKYSNSFLPLIENENIFALEVYLFIFVENSDSSFGLFNKNKISTLDKENKAVAKLNRIYAGLQNLYKANISINEIDEIDTHNLIYKLTNLKSKYVYQ